MAEAHKTHHHHHHHHMDDATRFKYNSLRAIELKKKAKKIGFKILLGIAILMMIIVVLAYTIG